MEGEREGEGERQQEEAGRTNERNAMQWGVGLRRKLAHSRVVEIP